jgi:hypothetical protein
LHGASSAGNCPIDEALPQELAPFRSALKTGLLRRLPRHQRAFPSAGLDEWLEVYGDELHSVKMVLAHLRGKSVS